MKIKDLGSRNANASFYLGFTIYCGFLSALFLKRLPFPDMSFDTMNYHYFAGFLAYSEIMWGSPSANFIPLGMHSFNPSFSLMNYVLSLSLGYRLGTVISLLGAIAAGFLAMKIAFRFMRPSFLNSLLLVPFLVVNESIFQIGTYFTDNLFAVVGISATLILLKLFDTNSRSQTWLLMALLGLFLGVQFWKPTNAILIIPQIFVALLSLRSAWLVGERVLAKSFVLATVPIASLSGFSYPLYMLLETGNPVFPYFNSLFESPYYPEASWGFNFGPRNTFEAIFYPIVSSFNPNLLGEVKDLFPDIKLNILFFLALSLLVIYRIGRVKITFRLKILIGLTFSSYALWALMFGYSRYAIGLELLFGVLVASLILSADLGAQKNLGATSLRLARILSVGLVASLSFGIASFNYKYDISFRPTLPPSEIRQEILKPDFFATNTFVHADISKELRSVDLVVSCANPTSGLIPSFPELARKPFINLDIVWNGAMTLQPDYVREVETRLYKSFGKKTLKFVAVYPATSLYTGPSDAFSSICNSALEAQRLAGRILEIGETKVIPSFLGSTYTDIILTFGTYELSTSRVNGFYTLITK